MPGPQKKTSSLMEMEADDRREHSRTQKYGPQQLTITRNHYCPAIAFGLDDNLFYFKDMNGF